MLKVRGPLTRHRRKTYGLKFCKELLIIYRTPCIFIAKSNYIHKMFNGSAIQLVRSEQLRAGGGDPDPWAVIGQFLDHVNYYASLLPDV